MEALMAKSESQARVDAIRLDMELRGISAREEAARIGVSHTTLNRWLSGAYQPKPAQFEDIEKTLSPRARQQLNQDTQYDIETPDFVAQVKEPRSTYNTGPTLSIIEPGELVRMPVMGMARAAGYMPAIHGDPCNFIDELGGDFELWDEVPRGHMLLRIDGNSNYPMLPHGSVVQVDFNQLPKRGQLVVARLTTEEYAICKYYNRKDNVIHLRSVNPDPEAGRNYRVDLNDPGETAILWMHPVVRYAATPPPPPPGWDD